jgi:SPP1 family predicted phage head-tail adaptor
MTAGDLRDRVLWLKPKRVTGPTGQPATVYEPVRETWAKVQAVAGGAGEGDEHAQLTPARGYEITIRSRTADVKHDWRVTWRGLVLEVEAVLPHPANGQFDLIRCHERPPTTTG